MNINIIVTLSIMALSVFGFTRSNLRSDWVAVMAMSALLVCGILTPSEAIKGFSNEATITVACMFAISAAFVKSGFVTLIVNQLSKYISFGPFIITLILMLITAIFSSFLNNTAIVAIFIPIALKIAKDLKMDRRKILMPISFAAIVGGTCTLVGTSTNIIVNSIYQRAGYDGFRMFDFSMIGALLAVGVICYLLLGGLRLLTKKNSTLEIEEEKYSTVIFINDDFEELDLKYMESNFCNLIEGNLIELKKNQDIFEDLSQLTIKSGDSVKLSCSIDKIKELKLLTGISFVSKESNEKIEDDMDIFEVIVPKDSPVVGRSLEQILYFRGHNVVPLGIKKNDMYHVQTIKDSIVSPGDLLVIAGRKEHELKLDQELKLKTIAFHSEQSVKPRLLITVGLVIVGFMLSTAFELSTALQASIISVSVLLLTRTISLSEVYESLDAQVLMLLASILSLGLALEKTGASKIIGDSLVYLSFGAPEFMIVAALFLMTSLMTEIMSNTATAAILGPIALSMAKALECSEKPLLLAVMMGASMSFMSPIGYQTNTMIYSAGGFKFSDFLRVGTVLNVFTMIVGSALIVYFFPLHK